MRHQVFFSVCHFGTTRIRVQKQSKSKSIPKSHCPLFSCNQHIRIHDKRRILFFYRTGTSLAFPSPQTSCKLAKVSAFPREVTSASIRSSPGKRITRWVLLGSHDRLATSMGELRGAARAGRRPRTARTAWTWPSWGRKGCGWIHAGRGGTVSASARVDGDDGGDLGGSGMGGKGSARARGTRALARAGGGTTVPESVDAGVGRGGVRARVSRE